MIASHIPQQKNCGERRPIDVHATLATAPFSPVQRHRRVFIRGE